MCVHRYRAQGLVQESVSRDFDLSFASPVVVMRAEPSCPREAVLNYRPLDFSPSYIVLPNLLPLQCR